MTDKKAFLSKLGAALRLRGVSELDAAPYLERFDRYWDRMVSESGETSESLSDIESVADTIAAQIAERGAEIDRFAERTMTVDAVTDAVIAAPTEEVTIPEEVAAPTEEVTIPDEAVMPTEEVPVQTEIDGLYDESDSVYSDEAECLIPAEELAALDGVGADEYTGEGTRLPDYKEDEHIPASSTFKLLTLASLPITVPLALVFLAAFGALWLLIMALMAAAVLTVVVLAAVGAAVSLVGIVFGVVQLFTGSAATGVYEIGLGVIVVGTVMLLCILLYNFAVRLMPYLMKLVLRLFKFTLGRLKKLYNHLKKESAKL